MICVDVSVKKFMYVKMIICDEVIKSYHEEIEIKTIPRDFNENKGTCKTLLSYFICICINYYNSDIDSS